jgi:hypothetical protein
MLFEPARNAFTRHVDERMFYHFVDCGVDWALDFLEYFFQVPPGQHGIKGVGIVNEIFREEGIGYELTPYREELVDDGSGTGRRNYQQTFPQIIRKSEEYLHDQIVKPALVALGGPDFDVANKEMLKAHQSLRDGDYPAVLTNAGSAMESTLKTICSKKKWQYKPEKDTLHALIMVCQKNDLFPSFYGDVFTTTGSIRNKSSSSHGRATAPPHTVTQDHANHMIQIVSAHINLLIKLANL